jgi:hypothetical protein
MDVKSVKMKPIHLEAFYNVNLVNLDTLDNLQIKCVYYVETIIFQMKFKINVYPVKLEHILTKEILLALLVQMDTLPP